MSSKNSVDENIMGETFVDDSDMIPKEIGAGPRR